MFRKQLRKCSYEDVQSARDLLFAYEGAEGRDTILCLIERLSRELARRGRKALASKT